MLPDVRTVTSNANLWEESKIEFGARIMRPGTEGVKLAGTDLVAPTTGNVQISTVLIRGEVPVTDEVLEDQVEQAGFSSTLMTMIAEAAGRDVEELMIQGDTGSGDAYLALSNGWLQLAQGGTGNVLNATSIGPDYQDIMKQLLNSIPARFKRDKANMRYYVSVTGEENYRDQVASRATVLGDVQLEGDRPIRYQGILIQPVPLFPVTAGSPDTSFMLLSNRQNLYAGWRRMVRIETWRDPREGGTSFVVSARVDAEIAHVPATAIATNVDVEP